MIYTTEAWDEMITAKNSGAKIEITEEVYDDFLESVAAGLHGASGQAAGHRTAAIHFGFAEGAEPITAFWRENGKFYCMQTNEMNRG